MCDRRKHGSWQLEVELRELLPQVKSGSPAVLMPSRSKWVGCTGPNSFAFEIARQRAFQEALWADDRFTQTTKQRIGALLRESGSAPAPARGDGPTSWLGPASPT